LQRRPAKFSAPTREKVAGRIRSGRRVEHEAVGLHQPEALLEEGVEIVNVLRHVG